MKKLLVAALALLGLAVSKAAAAPLYGYVQITTTTVLTPTLQNGSIKIASGTITNATHTNLTTQFLTGTSTASFVGVSGSTISYSSATFTGLTGSTVTYSSATFTNVSASTVTVSVGLVANGSAGSSGQLLKSNGAGTSPSWLTYSPAAGGSSGDVQYNSGGLFAGLTGATTGEALIAKGAGIAPIFQGGNSVQFISTSTTVGTGTASTTFVNSSLIGSINVTAGGHRVAVMAWGACANNTASDGASITIARNGTNLAGGTSGLTRVLNGSNVIGDVPCSVGFFDTSPATGNNTYAVQVKAVSGGSASFDAVDTQQMHMIEYAP